MVKFVQVDPAELDTSRLGRRGRISYPLIKQFLESNMKLAKLDTEDYDKNPVYLRSVLSAYIISHNLPIKIFSAQGDLHLMRLDLDNNGKPIPDWKAEMKTTEGHKGHLQNEPIVPLDSAEIERRFEEERRSPTK